jgi:hypothetical protein
MEPITAGWLQSGGELMDKLWPDAGFDSHPDLDWSLRLLGWVDVISTIAALFLILGLIHAMGVIQMRPW